MVRPKASDRNKAIATLFAAAVTVEVSKAAKQRRVNGSASASYSFARVPYKGGHSIYEALEMCLPSIIRKSRAAKNKKGVSEMELNKALVSRGYRSYRLRSRGESGWIWRRSRAAGYKWKSCRLLSVGCRWKKRKCRRLSGIADVRRCAARTLHCQLTTDHQESFLLVGSKALADLSRRVRGASTTRQALRLHQARGWRQEWRKPG